MVHILGQGHKHDDQADEQEQGVGERGRPYLTNFFSIGHMVPWGGSLGFRKIPPAEVQATFKDRRIDLFVIPDLEIMRDLLRNKAELSGQMPEGSEEEHENAFCQMIEATVQQMTQCRMVRTIPKPKPLATSRQTVFLQFYMQQGAVVGSAGLGCIWWEITPEKINPKPEAPPATQAQTP